MLDLAELDEWLTDTFLDDGSPIRWAGRQPEALNTPGLLCQLLRVRTLTLSGDVFELDVRLVLAVDDNDVVRATDALVELMNAARARLGNPPGDWDFITLRRPTASDLPALAYTYTLTIT